jgi:hypothetical protein
MNSRVAFGLSLVLAAQVVPGIAAPGIVVGENVHVSTAHAEEGHYETHAAAHPTDPARLLATAIIYAKTGPRGTLVYASDDAGKTWRVSLEGHHLVNTGDPALAFGPDGTAYFTALTSRGHPLEQVPAKPAHAWDGRKTILWRLPANAAHWEAPVTMRFADREYIAVDATRGKNHGRVYVTGDPRPLSGFAVFTSTDGGRTFSDPGAESDHRGASIGNAVVASDGTLIGLYADPEHVRAVTSIDGGATLRPSVIVDKFVRAGGRKDTRNNNVNHFLHLAIDGTTGAFKDRLYAAWPDRRSGHSQVLFASSADKGSTWSPARTVTDNAPTDQNDHFMPTVAVNNHGIVGLLWYDRRDNPDNLGYYARFSASLDGGKTWLPSVRVSKEPYVSGAVAKRSAFAGNGGDTAGLAPAADGAFHAIWIDDHTGVPQVYASRITVAR